jgi:hypothetical protein
MVADMFRMQSAPNFVFIILMYNSCFRVFELLGMLKWTFAALAV